MVSKTRLYNWYISLVAAMAMVLYGYDASVFNSVQASDNWLNWFGLNTKTDAYLIGLINTAYTIGAIVAGFFIGGPTADYLGRRWGIAIGCFVTIIATFMQTFAPYRAIGCFIAGRVLVGIGQGMALTAGPVYIGEMAPAHIRGYIMAFWQLFYSVGSFLAYWINYACSKHRATLGEWDWKMVVIFQMLVPGIIIILLPWQPETPRWHIQRHGDVDAARASLRKIRDTEQEVEEEIIAIREAMEYEKEITGVGYMALFKEPSIRKRLLLAFILNVGQQLTGQGTLNTYSTAIYKKVWPSTDTINLINALNATFGIIFTLNAVWTADRFGRRWLLLVGAIGMAIAMLMVSLVGILTPDGPGGTKSQPVGIAIVFCLFLFIFFYKPSWGATTWIWTAEVFSMNVRAQAVGMCSQMQNVANTIFQQFFPIFLQNTGLKCLFFFMAMNVVLAFYVYFFIPETRRIPLEEIDVLFGDKDHTVKGAQLLGIVDDKGVTELTDRKDNVTITRHSEGAEISRA